MVVYFFRTAWNFGVSTLERSVHRNKLSLNRLALADTHVWRGRAGLLDVGLNSHMNEAAVVSNIELARLNGVIQLILSQKWTVVVASNMVQYSGDKMHALQPYEVHSRIAYWDDSWQYFTHRFVCPDTGKFCESNHDQGSPSPDGSMPRVIQGFLAWDAATKINMERVQQPQPEYVRKELVTTTA
ncbi:hypothetical protein Ae201684P_018716 [Aphanomyces euteiches]|nr:hypothetical protein Ae201684P_018585 [Aphanomyces euteiches]KAH9099703.1 hypothetical protein Ae201684P_018716 [Aphanomyces euteiches]